MKNIINMFREICRVIKQIETNTAACAEAGRQSK
jgi:hypothetical protein